MKKIAAVFFVLTFVFTIPTFAHEFEKSSTLEALMYVEPHGEVKAGEVATIHVEFQTAPADFDLATGTVKLTLLDGDTILAQKTLADLDVTKTKNTFYFPFTFSHDGMYVLEVDGSVGDQVLEYHFDDIHVGMGEGLWHHLQYHFAHILIFGIGIIAGFILAFWKPKQK